MNNEITLETIEEIIENHMDNDHNFMFVCDEMLAEFISNYLEEIYGLEAENSSLYEEDEYYVSVLFDGEIPMFFCESARGISGKYKLSDMPDCDYFIFTDMSEDEAEKNLISEGGIWSWFEKEDENDLDDEDCENCEFYDECDERIDDFDESLEEERLIAECLDVVFGDTCIDCSIDSIIDLAYTFMKIGRQNAIDEMKDFVNFLDE
jgi:hypothetical protein